jgi:hypothetical protein
LAAEASLLVMHSSISVVATRLRVGIGESRIKLFFLLTYFSGVFLTCTGTGSGDRVQAQNLSFAEQVLKLASDMRRSVGDSIGTAIQARYIDNGRLVLIYDKFSPHLRLFTRDGKFVWSGGIDGDGPKEIRPWAIAVRNNEVVVVQPGRASYWHLINDSLAFQYSHLLPRTIAVRKAALGCRGELIIYGMPSGPTDTANHFVPFLYEAVVKGQDAILRPIWSDSVGPDLSTTMGAYSASSTLLASNSQGFFLYHRTNMNEPGRLAVFDCKGNLLDSHSEAQRVGERNQMAQGGIAATQDGMLISVFEGREEKGAYSKFTEVQILRNGRWFTTQQVPGIWWIGDYDQYAGLLLIGREPFPLYIVVPPTIIESGIK